MGRMRGRVTRKHPLAECEKCPLEDIGRFVPSVVPEEAAVAVVGEAPGRQEERKGIPFIGPSGALLDRVLKHHGIERKNVLLANACGCRPPDNSPPARSAVSACRPRLVEEIKASGVDTVVTLGNTATVTLIGLSGVMKLRVGPGKKSQLLPGVRVIPTIHPAACLRAATFFPDLVTDIGKIALNGIRSKWEMPRF